MRYSGKVVEESYNRMSFYCGCLVGNVIYASNTNYNGLFRINMDTWKVEFVGNFPDERSYQKELHRKVIRIQDELYFIPNKGTCISTYNIHTSQFGKITIPGVEGLLEFADAFVIENRLWMVPKFLKQPLYYIELQNKVVQEEQAWKKHMFQQEGFADLEAVGVLDNKIVVVPWNINKMFIYDLNSGQMKEKVLPREFHLRNLTCDGEYIWFTLRDDNRIVRYHWESGDIKIYAVEDESRKIIGNDELQFLAVFICGDRRFVVPSRADVFMEIDIEGGIIFAAKDLNSPISRYDKGILYLQSIRQGQRCFWLPKSAKELLELDVNNNQASWHKLEISDCGLEKYLRDFVITRGLADRFKMSGIEKEGTFSLTDYIYMLNTCDSEEYYNIQDENDNQSCGKLVIEACLPK